MVDGIDGSGKSTIINAWKKFLSKSGNTIFDLKNYWLQTGHYPDISELKSYDFIFSAEPTYVGIGKTIRTELISADCDYPALAIAEAYALDRLILYKKIILPLLKNKKCVIQDRGVSTSLAYQPLTDKSLDFKKLAALPGNDLALKNSPNYLILAHLDPKIAIQRLDERTDKKDNSKFEKLNFLKKADQTFFSASYQKIFTAHKTKIHRLEGSQKIDIMEQEAVNLLKNILNK